MGTNYYLCKKADGDFNRETSLRIGRSSAGWAFALFVYPDKSILNLSHWVKLFNNPAYLIYNEEGELLSVRQMIDNITHRKALPFTEESFSDNLHYKSLSDFLEKNNCHIGINNLLFPDNEYAPPNCTYRLIKSAHSN